MKRLNGQTKKLSFNYSKRTNYTCKKAWKPTCSLSIGCVDLKVILSSSLTSLQMNITKSLHICSFDCTSHVQTPFQSWVDAAVDALQNLFSPKEGLLSYIRDMPTKYPTQEQLMLARIVGLTLFKLYFSYLLLSEERKAEVGPATFSPCLYCLTLCSLFLAQHDGPRRLVRCAA
jgi:hypothetical protein